MWDLKGINHDAYAHGKCLLFSFVDMWCICPRIVLNVNINWSVQIKNSFLRSQYFCPWLPKLIDVWNKELSFYIYGRVIEQAWGQDGCIFAKSSFFVCLSETTQDDVKETEKKTKNIPCASRLQPVQSLWTETARSRLQPDKISLSIVY